MAAALAADRASAIGKGASSNATIATQQEEPAPAYSYAINAGATPPMPL